MFKSAHLTALFICLSTASALAQIGETLPQLTSRYGAPTGKKGNTFNRAGIEMVVTLDKDGKAKVISYTRRDDKSNDGQAHLTKQEVESFLKVNGKDWKLVDGKTSEWETKDKSASASYQAKFLTVAKLK